MSTYLPASFYDKLDYTEKYVSTVFGLLFAVGIILISVVCFIRLLLSCSKKRRQKKIAIQQLNASYYEFQNQSSHRQNDAAFSTNLGLNIYLVADWIENCGWLFISMCPIAFSMFAYIPLWVASFIQFGVLFFNRRRNEIREFHKLEAKYRFSTYEEKERAHQRRNASGVKRLAAIIIVSILCPILFMDSCISEWDQRMGLHVGTGSFSTAIERFIRLPIPCPPGPPCHVYASLAEDGATSVFINVHTSTSVDTLVMKYDTLEYYNQYGEDAMRYAATPFTFTTDLPGLFTNRNVHNTFVQGLIPDTTYVMAVYYDDQVQYTENYRTFPDATSQRGLNIAVGGDMGINDASAALTALSASTDPDLIVIGGDLSYDENMCTCSFIWDIYINQFEALNNQVGRMVPILFTVGNHDVGMMAMTFVEISIDRRGPAFLMYFPHHLVNGQVPDIKDRLPYHYHTFGNSLYLALDSGYLYNITGPQVDFIRNVSQTFPNAIKFAAYHNPIYFACFNEFDTPFQAYLGQQYWVPLFDQFNYAGVFEHHEHTFKKTFPLRGGIPNPLGTYYLGDGCMGAEPPSDCSVMNSTGIFDIVGLWQHVWHFNINYTTNQITYRALNVEGKDLITPFSQNINDYAR